MKIDYQIVSYHQPTAGIQVRYFNEHIPDGVMFSLNLPLLNGRLPRGEDLHQFIMSNAPKEVFERAATLRETGVPPELSNVPPPVARSDQFIEGQLFVHEGGQRIFLIRPLIQENSLDVPVEVL